MLGGQYVSLKLTRVDVVRVVNNSGAFGQVFSLSLWRKYKHPTAEEVAFDGIYKLCGRELHISYQFLLPKPDGIYPTYALGTVIRTDLRAKYTGLLSSEKKRSRKKRGKRNIIFSLLSHAYISRSLT